MGFSYPAAMICNVNLQVRVSCLAAWLMSGAAVAVAQVPVFTEYPLPNGGNSLPGGITSGPDGNLWFTEAFKIGKTTTQGLIAEFSIPTPNSSPAAITQGPDGNLW